MKFYRNLCHTKISDRTWQLKFLFINIQIQLFFCSFRVFFYPRPEFSLPRLRFRSADCEGD